MRTLAKILLVVLPDRPCQTIQCTSMFLNELTHLLLIDMTFVFRELLFVLLQGFCVRDGIAYARDYDEVLRL